MTQSTIARLPRAKQICGISRSEIYRREAEGRFPKRIVLGPRCIGWLESDLFAWVDQRVKESRAASGGAPA